MVFTFDETKSALSSGAGGLVLDVRRDDERKAERIPGTKHIPGERIFECLKII